MRKFHALLLALVVCLSLAACGKSAETPAASGNQAMIGAAEQKSDNSDSTILLDAPICLVDDDTVKIEVVDFFQQEYKWATGTLLEKGFTLKLYNKTDHELVVQLEAYLGADAAKVIMTGGSNGVMAGKNGQISYIVHKYSGSTETELASVDELYQLNGEIMVLNSYDDYMKNNSYYTSFSFSSPTGNGVSGGSAAASDTVLTAGNVSIDAIAVDDSYQDEEGTPLKMVYLFYTVDAKESNMKVDSVGTTLTINGSNTYTSEHRPNVADYAPSYYASTYLKDVYMGTQMKVVTTFKIPEADLVAGRSISLSDSQVPGMDEVTFDTDLIQHFDTAAALCQAIDPAGYDAAMLARQLADAATTQKVQSLVNGYYWSFYVNSTSYEIEFYSGNRYELRTAFGTTGGSYEVTNSYIIVTNSSTGAVNEIPYRFENGDITIDVADAFDVKEN